MGKERQGRFQEHTCHPGCRRGSGVRPRGYVTAPPGATDAKKIIKPKCQGLFSDLVRPSDWPSSDVTVIREQELRSGGGAREHDWVSESIM